MKRCWTCRKFKAEHQRSHGKMESFGVPVWKWEEITMYFITKLPHTMLWVDSIRVIVNSLIKSTHFIPIQERIYVKKLADVYIQEVVERHGVPVSVVSNRDVQFTSSF